jgi:hypothetical protein
LISQMMRKSWINWRVKVSTQVNSFFSTCFKSLPMCLTWCYHTIKSKGSIKEKDSTKINLRRYWLKSCRKVTSYLTHCLGVCFKDCSSKRKTASNCWCLPKAVNLLSKESYLWRIMITLLRKYSDWLCLISMDKKKLNTV